MYSSHILYAIVSTWSVTLCLLEASVQGHHDSTAETFAHFMSAGNSAFCLKILRRLHKEVYIIIIMQVKNEYNLVGTLKFSFTDVYV